MKQHVQFHCLIVLCRQTYVKRHRQTVLSMIIKMAMKIVAVPVIKSSFSSVIYIHNIYRRGNYEAVFRMNYHVRRPCDIQLLDKERESQDQVGQTMISDPHSFYS
jgi:hypothetical protein